MKNVLYALLCLTAITSCQKETVSTPDENIPPPERYVSDTLMIYQSTMTNGGTAVFSKRFKTGETKMLVANAAYPFATNERLVYIKDGKTLNYGRLDGVARTLADLNAPSYPCLTIDSRLIAAVDQSAGMYQLLALDTFGNKTKIFESALEISYPCFTSDGQQLVFVHKTSENASAISIIPAIGGTVRVVVPATDNVIKTGCTVLEQTLYFIQQQIINGKNSTEICSVATDGTNLLQNTNFTAGWSQSSFQMEQLRKINNTSLIFISTYGSNNQEIFTTKTNNVSNHTRLTFSDAKESFPSLIPEYNPAGK